MITFLVLFLITIHLDLESAANACKIVSFFFAVSAIVMAIDLFNSQVGLGDLLNAVQNGGFISQFVFWDLLLMLLLIPFIKGPGKSAYIAFFIMEALFGLINSFFWLPSMETYFSVEILFLTVFAYLKLSYVFNLLAEGFCYFFPKLDIKKIKPAFCIALFLIALGALNYLQ